MRYLIPLILFLALAWCSQRDIDHGYTREEIAGMEKLVSPMNNTQKMVYLYGQ